ncbi:hypothetical protein [Rhizocola hellebori]|uniref:hypothetical protein n=1 Tax=Rhizocola hellebori TaxID=1392758 RepID=UPI001944B7E2
MPRFVAREELRRTLIHEELHHRWVARGLSDHHPRLGSGSSERFYSIVQRYMSIRGWS